MSPSLDLSRQWLRMTLVAVAVLMIFSFMVNLMLRRSGFEETSGPPMVRFDQTKELDYHLRYGQLAERFAASRRPKKITWSRNLFEPYRPAEDFFELVDIRLEPLSLIYKGRIEQRDSSVVAQINWGDRTYFVRESEVIDDWRIVEISPEHVRVQNTQNEKLTLPYLQVTYRKERVAVLFNYRTQEELVVGLAGRADDFTVTDISDDSITLSGRETFTLRKRAAPVN